MNELIAACSRRAGIEHVTPHRLRHAFGSNLADAGSGLDEIATLMVYAGELRHVWLCVWLWADWPDRWGADAGVDLVAEDRRGQLWAIQAKAYDEATWIIKRDVDTFLAESARSVFSFRLLIATTNLIGRTAKRTIEAQEKQASVVLLGDLDAATGRASPSDLRRRWLAPKRPRPHQREAMR